MCFLLNTLLWLKKKVYSSRLQRTSSFFSLPPTSHREFVYLLQILHDSCEPLVFCLYVSDHSPALFQFVLHFQDLPQVVSFLWGRLLQKRFLPSLSILSNFTVDGEGLPKGLQKIWKEKECTIKCTVMALLNRLGKMFCFALFVRWAILQDL